MVVFMLMLMSETRITGSIIYHAIYVHNPVNFTIIDQSVEYTINCNPITPTVQLMLNCRLRQSHIRLLNQIQNSRSGNCISCCFHGTKLRKRNEKSGKEFRNLSVKSL